MKYAAFISYAHTDAKIARRIQNALETFSMPREFDASWRERLSPIFRDETELTAHHSLSDKISEAVESSRYLIVLCSPAAKKSHWVNEEIKLFRKLRGESSILAVIVEGTPQEAFPPALIEKRREPLAANLTSRDRFQLGVAQLAAAMLNVGLDEVLQRQIRRRRNRNLTILTASLVFSATMGIMAWSAILARNEANTSRTEAEGMVEFILTDLKADLEPIGKLDVLDDIGLRVSAYYDAIPIANMDVERIARQARTFHVLGDVSISQGKFDTADEYLTKSLALTKFTVETNSDRQPFRREYGQSHYWKSVYYLQQGEPDLAIPHADKFISIARNLYENDMENPNFIFDYAYALNNRGYVYYWKDNYEKSIEYYERANQIILKVNIDDLGSEKFVIQHAQQVSNIAVSLVQQGQIEAAVEKFDLAIRVMDNLHDMQPDNKIVQDKVLMIKMWKEHTKITRNNVCEPESIQPLVIEMEAMVSHDNSNQYWAYDHIELLYRALKNCENVLDDDWIEDRVKTIELLLAFNPLMTEIASDKVDWILTKAK